MLINHNMHRFTYYQWSWILAVVSFALRLPGFFVDLPPYQFVDEAIYTNGVYAIALTDWGWVPTNYLAGGINYYLPAIVVAITHKLFHVTLSMDQLIILSRIIGPGILSSLAIPLLFATGQQLFRNDKIALLSAAVLAFSPYMLSISRIWYPDHYAVVFSTLALYAAARIITTTSPSKKEYLLLGAAIGLSFSTKYNGLFFAALIPIAHAMAVANYPSWTMRLRQFFFAPQPWLAAAAMIVVFAAVNPYIFSKWQLYIDAIVLTRKNYLTNVGVLMVANTPVFYLQLLLFTTFGVLGGIVTLWSILFISRRNIKAALLLVTMPIIFIAMMSEYRNAIDRNVSVLIPYIALLCAAGLYSLSQYLNPRLLAILLIAVCLEPAARIALNTVHDFQPDSRQLAEAWIDQHIPPQSIVGLGRGTYNKGLGIPVDEKKFKVVELPFLPEVSKDACVDYYYIDQWLYQMFGKGKSVFVSPYYSENIFRNIGGLFFKKEHETTMKWLAQFKEIHRIKGNYYGPAVYIYKRKTPC